ncbi:hypothetical protein E2562_031156, partial [Oryza meyeriana var. granulata]
MSNLDAANDEHEDPVRPDLASGFKEMGRYWTSSRLLDHRCPDLLHLQPSASLWRRRLARAGRERGVEDRGSV